jgi:hypothetical protein
MAVGLYATRILIQEAQALLARLARVKALALHETMVPAAALSPFAQIAIERHLVQGRRDVYEMVNRFLKWLDGPNGMQSSPSEAQRRFTLVRLKFNMMLAQFDLFSDALSQRSEHETGVWLAGLDALASDALTFPPYYQAPAVVCYLDRGIGAAIRRARTRLPGGGESPTAIIRVPRERMVGSGIASSLVHEVGHQAAALLNLVSSLRPLLHEMFRADGMGDWSPWRFWERWISEIVADYWSIARIGVGSTLGLIAVMSVPRAFAFRINMDDPHPVPWLRVKLSCGLGRALYPHPQWARLAALWETLYPLHGLDKQRRQLLSVLEKSIPDFVDLLIHHRPKALQGNSLSEAMDLEARQPSRLRTQFDTWLSRSSKIRTASPSMVFAVIGQAKADGRIEPQAESRVVGDMLTHWALRGALNASAICRAAAQPPVPTPLS